MGNLGNHRAGKTEEVAIRRTAVVDLRVKGRSFRAIADQLGIPKTVVHRDCQNVMAELADKRHASADQLRALQGERLERVIAAAWGIMEGETTSDETKLRAMEQVRRTVETIARLYGLNAEQAIVNVDQRSITFVIQEAKPAPLALVPTPSEDSEGAADVNDSGLSVDP